MVGEPEDRDAHWVTASSSPRIATDRRKSIHSQTSRPGIRVDRPGTRFIDISTIARPHAGKEVTGEVLDFAWLVLVPVLRTIKTRSEFDEQHRAWVKELRQRLVPHNGQPASYGQGQKSLNVFLKFYVDWASRPDPDTACRLRPWLHCPLDKVVMEGLCKEFREEYQRRLRPLHGGSPQQRFSLSQMSEEAYRAWQAWIRELSPLKPVLVDVAWALERAT